MPQGSPSFITLIFNLLNSKKDIMLKCLVSIPKSNLRKFPTRFACNIQNCKPIQFQKRFQSSIEQFTSNSQTKPEPILTELVYGRKRIYTSLQTIGKTKSATASKGRIAAPVTTSPMSWQWIQPAEDANQKKKREWYQLKQNNSGFSALNSMKQNMREMFLPVGYPESVHDCYKKFHAWLFLETYVGSAVGWHTAKKNVDSVCTDWLYDGRLACCAHKQCWPH